MKSDTKARSPVRGLGELRVRLGRVGVKWRIFGGFAVFVAVMLALLWVFQVIFLDNFYRTIKIHEIKTTSQNICDNINSAKLSDTLEDIARTNQMCIIISDEAGNRLYIQNTLPSSVIVDLSRLGRAAVYAVTVQNGGVYMERFRENPVLAGIPEQTAAEVNLDLPESMIYAQMVDYQGSQVMVLLNSSISPVGATVQTLRVQLIIITAAMLIMALLLALYLSRRISSPIEKINTSAKELAKGHYGVRFAQEGYREIAELGETLTYAATELSKVEALQRELVANISHDLRTPLTMIAGYAEVMKDLPGENTPENVQIIIDEANRLTSLVNDVLDLSRLQAGVQSMQLSNFCLTQSIREILNRYAKLTDYHILFTGPEDVFVLADELKISQVVYNLVNNALTYTGADKTVTLRQTLENGRVRVSVSDTGEGIPPDKLKDIWERYYKVDKAHKRAQVGTGLGLSIVKTILEAHGGAYGVESRENVGSTFWFELKVATPQENSGEKKRLSE